MSEVLLKVQNLCKSFFNVRVLRDVGFELRRGAVLGLVGENGSGKSTTMNIIGGVLAKDEGLIELDGRSIAPTNSRDAQALGIAFIHQELSLFPNLSVEENLFLDHFPRLTSALPFIDRRKLRELARKALELVDLKVAPQTPVLRLPPGERQLVEIAKALSRQARLIIFDEPTTSLTAREAERLFEIIRRLRAQGISVIYISHILGDVMRLCDDIVVLRDGQVVASEPRVNFTIERLVTLMVGRTIDQLFPERAPVSGPRRAALTVRGVSQPGVVKDISFDLNLGEVLGVSGLMGSGRSELARILFGLDPYSDGEICVGDTRLVPLSPRSAMDRGMAFLTENRRGEGLMMEASIADNIVLPSLIEQSHGFAHFLRPAQLSGVARGVAARVQVNAKTIDRTAVRMLSGGNQQKVVIGKWLLRAPSIFILDEPTRGIDVGAKYEVYKIINEMVEGGAAILLISSEIEELIGMADRIMVMGRGEVRSFCERANFDRETLLSAALWD
ncbi:sugar ABC transporter ATP-binding protein [Methylocapsa sp. S129]|uniref:sugar ABC transporter ATP-binding protein n=1 Tax=Methylocapsa sp. S129 TaxID=1641869 RepID=UPI001FEF6C9C|nr:sugar ABC transporter ATP-binding protein [Methylocapsa sp. S129]